MPDPARIEAHQVEAAADLGIGQRDTHPGDGVDRRGARPARVDHEHAETVAGGRDPDDRELRLGAVGLVVVHRHRHGAALGGGDPPRIGDDLLAAPHTGGCP